MAKKRRHTKKRSTGKTSRKPSDFRRVLKRKEKTGTRSSTAKKKKQRIRRWRQGILLLVIVVIIGAALFAGSGGYEYVSEKIHEDAEYPRPYHDIVRTYAAQYDVPESVIYGVMRTESHFRKDAQSQVGACGLMQLMPETFEWIQDKLGENLEKQEIFDPETNIQYATYYLAWLHETYPEWETVYAAYNAGPSSVSAWLEKNDKDGDGVLTSIPYEETASYVEKVGAAREQYQEIYNVA